MPARKLPSMTLPDLLGDLLPSRSLPAVPVQGITTAGQSYGIFCFVIKITHPSVSPFSVNQPGKKSVGFQESKVAIPGKGSVNRSIFSLKSSPAPLVVMAVDVADE